MSHPRTLHVTTPNDRDIVIVREFDAPRHLVFEALRTPELIRQWLLGPPGWTMPVCEFPRKAGEPYRYVWRNQHGTEMGMGGMVLEMVPPERIVATERFDDAWYPGEAVDTMELVERAGRTTLTITVRYESKAARDVALRSGMETGMAAGYERLDHLLVGMAAGRP